LRIKEQETCLTLQEHDDDDDDKLFGSFLYQTWQVRGGVKMKKVVIKKRDDSSYNKATLKQ